MRWRLLVLLLPVALALAAPQIAGARRKAATLRRWCDYKHARACAERELGVERLVFSELARAAGALVPVDSLDKLSTAQSTRVRGCVTARGDEATGAYALTLDACAIPGGTLTGTIGGTVQVDAVGGIPDLSGCGTTLAAGPLGTSCPLDSQVGASAAVALVATDDATGIVSHIACAGTDGAGPLSALVAVQVVATKVAPDAPGATCLVFGSVCTTFTAEPTLVAVSGGCTSAPRLDGRAARGPSAIDAEGFLFPLAPGADGPVPGCALAGTTTIAPPVGRFVIEASFAGDCAPAARATRRKRTKSLGTVEGF